jgi:hypothetical protein
MKTALKISVFLNLCLLTGLIYTGVWIVRHGLAAAEALPDEAAPSAITMTPPVENRVEPPPLRQNQFASSAHRVYAANSLPRTNAVVTSDSVAAAQPLAAGLSSAKIDLSSPAAVNPPPSVSPASIARNRRATPPVPVVYPLVFQEANLAALNLNAQQLQAINDLRQTFVDEIGGLNQNPDDPDYLQRWLKAQADVDNLARGLLGIMPWETYQVAAWSQSQ